MKGQLEGEEMVQLLVPSSFRESVWRLAYATPSEAHLGCDKTIAKITQWFYWPGLSEEIAPKCAACAECQKVNETQPPRAPLQVMTIINTLFDCIAMDIVSPLPKSSTGHQFILVMVHYATRYPDAVPLRSVTAPHIAEELLKWVSRVNIPQEILTDQGTNFMSRVMKTMCQVLRVKQLCTSVYHPQNSGLVE